MAAWSPPPQARRRRVISAEEAVSMRHLLYRPTKKTLDGIIVPPRNSRLACGGGNAIHLGIDWGDGPGGNRHGGRDMHGGGTDSQFGYRPAGRAVSGEIHGRRDVRPDWRAGRVGGRRRARER